MQFYENQYYHLYNRTNNEEALFRSDENYLYFLKKYRFYLDDYLDTIGYCLMPTHFHFLVRVKTFQTQHLEQDGAHLQGGLHLNQLGGLHLPNISKTISDKIGILLSSYTKAINRKYNRHGSLFQEHSKAKLITNDCYIISLLTYIHQNPIRSGLTEKAEEWKYSSYQDYIDLRNGTLPKKDVIMDMIRKNELRDLTEKRLIEI
ncbi:MAG: transposase [Candidatus Kapabacteria bacterium]|jgi:REP element-mobilizing transposase RayT|nr:transposase [Candidatus Kapabacteria bacterium]